MLKLNASVLPEDKSTMVFIHKTMKEETFPYFYVLFLFLVCSVANTVLYFPVIKESE